MRRLSRRGASAVEFAVTLPIFVMLVGGILDYGYYFALQSQAMSAVSGALYAGTHIKPDANDGVGQCAECRSAAAMHAELALENLGFEVRRQDVWPEITRIADTCALTLDVELAHQEVVGLVPMPERHVFTVNALLLKVDDC